MTAKRKQMRELFVCAGWLLTAALILTGSEQARAGAAPAGNDGRVESMQARPWLARRRANKGKPRKPPRRDRSPRPPPTETMQPPALPTAFTAVAMLPMHSISADPAVVQQVEEWIFEEVEATEGLRAVPPADVMRDIESFGVTAGCHHEPVCLARAGRYARAHLVIETYVAMVGGTLSVSIRMVDTQTGVEKGRVAESLSDEPEQRRAELDRLLVQLLTPGSYVGSLTVISEVDGADVYLDDRLMGTTPLAGALAQIPAGPHILRVTKPGFASLYQFVDVLFGRHTTITVDLNANTVTGVLVQAESRDVGALYVAAREPGLEIRVDGEPRGTTPLTASLTNIAAGKRRISLRKPGLPPVQQEIDIPANMRVDLAVTVDHDGMQLAAPVVSLASAPLPHAGELNARPLPAVREAPRPVPSWRLTAALASGGLAVAGFAGWSYFGYQVEQTEKLASSKLEAVRSGEADPARYDVERAALDRDGRAAERNAWLCLTGGGLMAVAAGALLAWEIISPRAAPAAMGSTSAPRAGVQLVPTDGGARLTLSGAW